MTRPEDITPEEYDLVCGACRSEGVEGAYDRLTDYVCALEEYTDTLEAQLSLESRQPTVEPGAVKDDIKGFHEEIGRLRADLKSAEEARSHFESEAMKAKYQANDLRLAFIKHEEETRAKLAAMPQAVTTVTESDPRVPELTQQVGALTSELASAQARLFSIGLLTR